MRIILNQKSTLQSHTSTTINYLCLKKFLFNKCNLKFFSFEPNMIEDLNEKTDEKDLIPIKPTVSYNLYFVPKLEIKFDIIKYC